MKDFEARRKAWLYYDKDTDRLNADIIAHNKGVILVCPKCHKVDVHPIYHASKCDPAAEQSRQEAQEVYWK